MPARTLWLTSFAAAAIVLVMATASGAAADDTQVSVVQRPRADVRNAFYPSNREPLAPSPLVKLPKPRTIFWSDVYWFDDTGRGGCRVPASWQLLYKDGDAWKPVTLAAGTTYGTAKDTFNKVALEPVTTSEVRLEVKLQPDVSGGILEWRIGPAEK